MISPPDHHALPARSPGSVYRDGTDALRQEAARLRSRHMAAIDALRHPAEAVYVARYARTVAGKALLGSVVALIVAGVGGTVVLDGYPWSGPCCSIGDRTLLTTVLLASWPLAGGMFLLARLVAQRRFARHMLAPLGGSGDVHADLDRMRRYDPGQHAMSLLGSMEAGSIAPLLAGVVLLLPLTIHFLAGALIGAEIAGFDDWILASAVVVGHCHLILAVRAWRHGKRMAMASTAEILAERFDAGWKTYAIVLAASLFPGVLLLFVPVILVAVTGLFIPVIYGWSARRLAAERDLLAMSAFRALSAATRRAP